MSKIVSEHLAIASIGASGLYRTLGNAAASPPINSDLSDADFHGHYSSPWSVFALRVNRYIPKGKFYNRHRLAEALAAYTEQVKR